MATWDPMFGYAAVCRPDGCGADGALSATRSWKSTPLAWAVGHGPWELSYENLSRLTHPATLENNVTYHMILCSSRHRVGKHTF